MRYKIEYLLQVTDVGAVFESSETEQDLRMAELKARLNSANAKRAFRAGAFQIRDIEDGGRIVALESFDEPLARFWPHAGDHVIH